MLRLYENEDKRFDSSQWIISEMKVQGLLDAASNDFPRLSRRGRLLAYNIEEFEIQVENRRMLPTLEKLNIFPGSVVLDVGCGGGQTLFSLTDRHPSLALGMDHDGGHLEIAQSFALNFPLRNGSFAFQQGDGNYLPFKDASIDCLICRGVLHHLNIRQAFHEMARVLKPGGRVFIHALALGSFIEQFRESDYSGKVFALFGILNGIFYFLTGRQIAVRYRDHLVRAAFLTRRSLRSLERSGIKIKSLEQVPERTLAGYYVLVGEKS